MYDLIIIGGGPAGTAAGVYASRKRLKTLFITKEWGGQSTVSPDIQNWIGTPNISGDALAKSLAEHLRAYADDVLTIKEKSLVTKLTKNGEGFSVTLDDGSIESGRAVLVASGSKRRQLTAPGADVFENKGLTYCASCDGPLFAGMDVAVIGGGNAGFETAAQLLAYAKSVTLLHHGEKFKADPVTIDHVLSHPNMKAIAGAETTAIVGDKFVSGLRYKESATGIEHDLPVSGIFVEIGMIPNTDFVKDILPLDEYGRVKIDPWTQKTEVPGVWAAGDCTNIKYHQNNISAGDAVKALEDIYVTLKTK
jgi:alkyl hydroperoxide reductase subunit F